MERTTHCRYCEKPLSFLQRMSHQQFCSSAHQKAFAETRDEMALARLLSSRPGTPPPIPDSQAATASTPETVSGSRESRVPAVVEKPVPEMAPTLPESLFPAGEIPSLRTVSKSLRFTIAPTAKSLPLEMVGPILEPPPAEAAACETSAMIPPAAFLASPHPKAAECASRTRGSTYVRWRGRPLKTLSGSRIPLVAPPAFRPDGQPGEPSIAPFLEQPLSFPQVFGRLENFLLPFAISPWDGRLDLILPNAALAVTDSLECHDSRTGESTSQALEALTIAPPVPDVEVKPEEGAPDVASDATWLWHGTLMVTRAAQPALTDHVPAWDLLSPVPTVPAVPVNLAAPQSDPSSWRHAAEQRLPTAVPAIRPERTKTGEPDLAGSSVHCIDAIPLTASVRGPASPERWQTFLRYPESGDSLPPCAIPTPLELPSPVSAETSASPRTVGSLVMPLLWHLSHRLEREPRQPASAQPLRSNPVRGAIDPRSYGAMASVLETPPFPRLEAHPDPPVIHDPAPVESTPPPEPASCASGNDTSTIHPPLAARLIVRLRPQDFPVMPLLSPVGFAFSRSTPEGVHA